MNRYPTRSDQYLSGSLRVLGLLVAAGAGIACSAEGDQGGAGAVKYLPSAAPTAAPPLTGTEQHAAPQSLGAAGAPAPSQPVSTMVLPAPAVPSPAITPVPTAPAAPAPAPAAAPSEGASNFDAGSGVMQADGKTIIYRIPDGTGGQDWNPSDKPIKVQRGMTLTLIDDDKSTRSGGHWLHTNGQPCTHGLRPIGEGFDCVIGARAPTGVVFGTFEHNIANGIGRLYIEVVDGPAGAPAAPAPATDAAR